MSELPKPKKKSILKRPWLWIVVAIVVLLVIGALAAMRGFAESKKKSLSYLEQTVAVATSDLERTISATGSVAADAEQPVYVGVSGTISSVSVHAGDLVSKDDALFAVHSSAGPTITIKAPFDGRVLSSTIFEDQTVAAAQVAMVLAYRSTHVEFFANDAEAVALKNGQTAHMTIPSLNNGRDVYDGTVTFVDVQKTVAAQTGITQATSGYLVKISDDNLPEDIRTRIGLVIDISIVTDSVTNRVAVDKSAIQYTDDDAPFVYRAPELTDDFYAKALRAKNITDVLEKVDITTGFEGDDSIEVLSGLSIGDAVLLYVPKTTDTTVQ